MFLKGFKIDYNIINKSLGKRTVRVEKFIFKTLNVNRKVFKACNSNNILFNFTVYNNYKKVIILKVNKKLVKK